MGEMLVFLVNILDVSTVVWSSTTERSGQSITVCTTTISYTDANIAATIIEMVILWKRTSKW